MSEMSSHRAPRKCKMVDLECWHCHQMGHVKADCPFYVCKTCGQQGHLYMQCRKCMMCLREDCKPGECPEAFCLSCGQWGHVWWECPRKIQRQNNGIAMQAAARNNTSVAQVRQRTSEWGHVHANDEAACRQANTPPPETRAEFGSRGHERMVDGRKVISWVKDDPSPAQDPVPSPGTKRALSGEGVKQKCHHCNKTGHSQADCLSLCMREMSRARKLRDEMRVANRKTVRK